MIQALGVNTTNSIYTCNSENVIDSTIRAALVYTFRIILNIISFILAILSCFRVKHKAVNDAKSVMAIIYVNTAFAIIASTTGVLFTQNINVISSLASLSVIVIPTSILLFTFIPKVSYTTNDNNIFSAGNNRKLILQNIYNCVEYDIQYSILNVYMHISTHRIIKL